MMWRVTCCCPLASLSDGLHLNSKCFGLRTSPRVWQFFLLHLFSKGAHQTIFFGILSHFLIPQGGIALAYTKRFPFINCWVTVTFNTCTEFSDSQMSSFKLMTEKIRESWYYFVYDGILFCSWSYRMFLFKNG